MTEKELRRRKIRIKRRLEDMGLSGAIIGRRLGMSRMGVNQVIAGKNRSRRVEEYLVEVGIPAGLVWPVFCRGDRRSGEVGPKEHRRDACATEGKAQAGKQAPPKERRLRYGRNGSGSQGGGG